MNFFEHQDQARRQTTQLIALFGLAIALMIVALYSVIVLSINAAIPQGAQWWQPELFLLTTVGLLSVIAFGSLTKLFELRRGGAVVATNLGGQRVDPQTDDSQEQQLLNVVAEMALASGTPIPTVYRLPQEPGINAFAAGYTPDDAVIAVTQGCLDQLSRDQLQGVIAHEFSHILNGDMRLNLKLIGVLQGLLFVHILGRMIVRSGWHASWGSRRDKDKNGAGLLLLGIALAVLGGIGLVAGRLIKSAVSRQREFLADASAVQFTRNPDGIAGALRRIGGFSARSILQTPKAEEASHLFFSEAMTFTVMSQWFATHPPLAERIRRITGLAIDPTAATTTAATGPLTAAAGMGLHAGGTPVPAASSPANSSTAVASPAAFLERVGTTSAQQLATTQAFLAALPPEITLALRSPTGAMTLVYSLLMDSDPAVQSRQLAQLQSAHLDLDIEQVSQLATQVQSIDPRRRLSLLDLTVPMLRTITAQQCAEFFRQVKTLVRADGRLSMSEYVLQIILQKRLRPHFQKSRQQPASISNLEALWDDCLVVLTILARSGHKRPGDAFLALKSSLSRLPGASRRALPQSPPAVKLYDLGRSLQHLEAATPKLKQAIVDAAAHAVLMDETVTLREAELLRAVVIALDCPIPPFLETPPRAQNTATVKGKRMKG